MTENTTNISGADAGSGSALSTVDSPAGRAGIADEFTEAGEFSGDMSRALPGTHDNAPAGGAASDRDDVLSSGAVAGGLGFAGLALAVVSLTTNWTSGVIASRSQYSEEVHAPSSGLTAQQELNMYASGWHTQAWWAIIFAAAAVLAGAGALLAPRLLRDRAIPGWAKAAATSAVIVGLVGALLAVLTLTGVFGGHLRAPSSAG
jgi:hypothetical protein